MPAANLLGGEEGLAFATFMAGIEVGRVNIAARGVGLAQAAFDARIRTRSSASVREADRRAPGDPLKLADMATEIEAARQLDVSRGREKDRGERADIEAGMAKLFASEVAPRRDRGDADPRRLRLHPRVPVERYYRDAPRMRSARARTRSSSSVIARRLLEAAAVAEQDGRSRTLQAPARRRIGPPYSPGGRRREVQASTPSSSGGLASRQQQVYAEVHEQIENADRLGFDTFPRRALLLPEVLGLHRPDRALRRRSAAHVTDQLRTLVHVLPSATRWCRPRGSPSPTS